MSLNLYFEKDGTLLDFPFQTPTDLTLKVLGNNAGVKNGKQLQYRLLVEYVTTRDHWDQEFKSRVLWTIREELFSGGYSLTYL